jgi:hypothetical protein
LPLVPPDEPAAPPPVEPPAQRRTALEAAPAGTATQSSVDPEVSAPVPDGGATADGVRVRP